MRALSVLIFLSSFAGSARAQDCEATCVFNCDVFCLEQGRDGGNVIDGNCEPGDVCCSCYTNPPPQPDCQATCAEDCDAFCFAEGRDGGTVIDGTCDFGDDCCSCNPIPPPPPVPTPSGPGPTPSGPGPTPSGPDPQTVADPWFVGFRDQHFLFQGKNNKWYSLLHDPPLTNMNVRIVEPATSKDNLETYINGVALESTSEGGEKNRVSIVVKKPEDFKPICTLKGAKSACIGEGAFEMKINDMEVNRPGFYTIDEETWMGVFNTNYYCLRVPHSHTHWDEFLEAKDKQTNKARRRLLSHSLSHGEENMLLDMILKKDVFDSEKCKAWIGERRERRDLFDQKGTMSTIFYSSPSLSLRIEYIMNIDETWSNHHRFDIFFTNYIPSRRQTGIDKRSGVLGETAFLKYNEKGEAILSDRDLILSGKDEDYEVKGPFETDFKAKSFVKLN